MSAYHTKPACMAEQSGNIPPELAVADMDRPEAMKHVVGPMLMRLFQPVFDPCFLPREESYLRPIQTFGDIPSFANKGAMLLQARFGAMSLARTAEYKSLSKIVRKTKAPLFSFKNADGVVNEALTSGVVIPMTVATQIHRIETGQAETSSEELRMQGVEATDLSRIMRRETFQCILQRLTKGPNGFLGDAATRPEPGRAAFFEFRLPDDQILRVQDAFDVENGEVTGLSSAYHVAAERQRTEAREIDHILEGLPECAQAAHLYYAQSSGCPVRHKFRDRATGRPQEPLILVANKFVAAALDRSAQLTATAQAQLDIV